MIQPPSCGLDSTSLTANQPPAGPYAEDVLGAYNTAWSAALIAQGFDMDTGATEFLSTQVGALAGQPMRNRGALQGALAAVCHACAVGDGPGL